MTNKEETSRNFAENLERERIALNLTQSQMAKSLDMSLSAYKNLLSGNTCNVSLHTICLVYELTGKYAFELCGLKVKEAEIIRTFKLLSPNQQNFLRMVADAEIQLAASGNDKIHVIVPTTNMEDGMLWDSCTYETVRVPEHYNADCGIKVTSNHLHPAYVNGDIILIKNRPPRDGDVGVFIHKPTGRAYLRKFKQSNPCRLEPINGFGKTFEVNPHDTADMDQWIKLGCVITRLRGY